MTWNCIHWCSRHGIDRVKLWIMLCTLISNSAYATIAPFLPIELDGKGISTIWVGPIFACYAVGVIVISPCVGRWVAPTLGDVTTIALGLSGMGLSLACFGLIMFSNRHSVIIGLAVATRFMQGASSAFIQTTCYLIATNVYPDQKEQLVGLVEATTGVGLLLGPVIGSALYAATNFEMTFLILGGITFATSLGVKLIGFRPHKTTTGVAPEIPGNNDDNSTEVNTSSEGSKCDESPEDSSLVEDAESGVQEGVVEKVSFRCLIRRARFFMALISGTLCYFMYCFLEPILAERLLDFDLTVPQIGLFFALFSIIYIPTSIAFQWIPKWIEKRVIISASLLVSSVSFLLIGPSELFRFPNSLAMIAIGWSCLGVSLATFLIPILPEMVESALPFFPGQETEVNNLSSALFNSFLGLGQVLAPLYGSAVTEWLGYRMTTDIAAIMGFIFMGVYFVLADVREPFRRRDEVVE